MAGKKTLEELKQTAILDVAQALGLNLKRSGRNYLWAEHDSFVITPEKNMFAWFSRDISGDVIDLVKTVKEEQSGQAVSFKEAKHFLETGEFKIAEVTEDPPKPFTYYLQRFENQGFKEANAYLIQERGLSQDTIDFFRSKGVLAQANHKTGNVIEPVVVFKTLDSAGKVTGASLQGIKENKKLHDRGRLKQLMRASDGLSGMHVDIGQPRRLIVGESPIDLMSYYQLHKDQLQDVRLLAMDGLKEGAISRHFMELLHLQQGLVYEADRQTSSKALAALAKTSKYFDNPDNADKITLAVDNDGAGRNFVSKIKDKGIKVAVDIPKITVASQEKNDWNDALKSVAADPETAAALTEPGYHLYYLDEQKPANRYEGYYGQAAALVKLKQAQSVNRLIIASETALQADELPPAEEEAWQDYINQHPEQTVVQEDSYQLKRAKQKLERLEKEFGEAVEGVFDHTKQRNGQPSMPWKRGEQTWQRRNEQLNDKARRLQAEIEAQKDRIERLEGQEVSKAQGFDKRGRGLVMSIENIPNIRAELAKADRGESWFSAATIRKYRKDLTRLEALRDQTSQISISPGAQTLIDQGQVTQWKKQPMTYFVNGLRRVALELTRDGVFQLGQKYVPKTEQEKAKVEELLQLQEKSQEKKPEQTQAEEKGASMPDTTPGNKGAIFPPEEQGTLFNNLNDVMPDQSQATDPQLRQEAATSDPDTLKDFATGTDKQPEVSVTTEKALEDSQGLTAESNFGDLPDMQEAAPLPDAGHPHPLEDLSPDQPQSQPLLHFSTKADSKSSPYKKNYHAVTDKELRKLNRYAPTIQESAKWYLDNLADSQVTYFYQDGNEVKSISIDYLKENFMHLTGLAPTGPGQTPEKTLVDLAQGKGEFDHLLIANKGATFDKLKVLPDLQAITEAESFFFGDLSSVERLHALELDKAIRSSDKDLLLALRTVDDGEGPKHFPASLLRLKEKLNISLDASRSEKTILGVFRSRDGVVDTLSINQEYIKDNGQAMKAIVENGSLEPVEKSFKTLKAKVTAVERAQEFTYQAGDVVAYESFAKEFYQLNNELYPEHQAILEATGRISPHLPYQTIVIDLLDGEGNVVQSDIRLTIGQEKEGISAHLKADIEPELRASIEEMDKSLRPSGQETTKKSSLFNNLRDRAGKVFQNFRSSQASSSPKTEAVAGENPGQFEPTKEEETLSRTSQPSGSKKDESKVTESVKTDNRTVTQMIADRDTEAVSQQMTDRMQVYFNPDDYKDYLSTMGRLHQYSPKNLQLLKEQRPNVSAVASAKTWNSLGRMINKGEKALRVWAPNKVPKKDKQTGQPILDAKGKPVTEIHFIPVPVFDISQTNGKDVTLDTTISKGDHDAYANLYRAAKSIAESQGLQVELSNQLPPGTTGKYQHEGAKIVLQTGQSEESTLTALFRELAMANLSQTTNNNNLTLSTATHQADSIAYVIANHFGFDTSAQKFTYLSDWQQKQSGLKELEAQLKIVQKEASHLIRQLDDAFEKYQTKNRSKNNVFAEKLERFKEESKQQLQQKNEVQRDPKKDLGSHHLSPNLP